MCDIAANYKYGKISANEIWKEYPQISKSRIKAIVYNAETYLDVFEFELADIIIRVLDLAAYKEINIERHIKAKLRYNKLREYKHGKNY